MVASTLRPPWSLRFCDAIFVPLREWQVRSLYQFWVGVSSESVHWFANVRLQSWCIPPKMVPLTLGFNPGCTLTNLFSDLLSRIFCLLWKNIRFTFACSKSRSRTCVDSGAFNANVREKNLTLYDVLRGSLETKIKEEMPRFRYPKHVEEFFYAIDVARASPPCIVENMSRPSWDTKFATQRLDGRKEFTNASSTLHHFKVSFLHLS